MGRKDTDDEECDKKQRLEINSDWDSEDSAADYEDDFFPKYDNYPLSTSDQHYRSLLMGDSVGFGKHYQRHLAENQYKKKRFTL